LSADNEVVVAGHHKLPFDGMPLMPVNQPAAQQDDEQNNSQESP